MNLFRTLAAVWRMKLPSLKRGLRSSLPQLSSTLGPSRQLKKVCLLSALLFAIAYGKSLTIEDRQAIAISTSRSSTEPTASVSDSREATNSYSTSVRLPCQQFLGEIRSSSQISNDGISYGSSEDWERGRNYSTQAISLNSAHIYAFCDKAGRFASGIVTGNMMSASSDSDMVHMVSGVIAAVAKEEWLKAGRTFLDAYGVAWSRLKDDSEKLPKSISGRVGPLILTVTAYSTRYVEAIITQFDEVLPPELPAGFARLRAEQRAHSDTLAAVTNWRCSPSDPDGIAGMSGETSEYSSAPAFQTGRCWILISDASLKYDAKKFVGRHLSMFEMGCYRQGPSTIMCVPFGRGWMQVADRIMRLTAPSTSGEALSDACSHFFAATDNQACKFNIDFTLRSYDPFSPGQYQVEGLRLVRKQN